MTTPSTILRTEGRRNERFRPAPDPSPSPAGRPGIFGALITEWARLCAMPSMTRTLDRWARTEPVLAGSCTLHDLLTRIDARDREQTDQLLLALIRLAQAGQQLAGRVVLQAMLPKLATMVRTSHSVPDAATIEDRRHVAVATLWEVLSSYPVNRRLRGVAGNLALDTLHRLTAAQRQPAAEIPVDSLDRSLDPTMAPSPDPTPDAAADGSISPDADLLEVIAWGIDVHAITPDEAALLVRVYVPAPGEPGGDVAAGAALGLSPAAVRQRCSRARRRLTTAVRADVTGRSTTPAIAAAAA